MVQLQSNKIKVIDSDVFEANPNLTDIWLYGNQINHVAEGAFSHLKKLKFLSLRSNKCEGKVHGEAREDVLEVIENVEKNCKNL